MSDRERKDVLVDVMASLAAAISLLERTPKAKMAAPSNKMFDQMLVDYRASLGRGRLALATLPNAVLAERERCARIADTLSGLYYARRSQTADENYRSILTAKHTACSEIAAAIRTPPATPKDAA